MDLRRMNRYEKCGALLQAEKQHLSPAQRHATPITFTRAGDTIRNGAFCEGSPVIS
jgi:hypothetical protein